MDPLCLQLKTSPSGLAIILLIVRSVTGPIAAEASVASAAKTANEVKRDISLRHPPPQTTEQLTEAIVEAWDKIPVQKINNYIDSIPRRIKAVIDALGGPTKY